MTVNSKEQAWAEVNKIFPTDYEKDYASSERAGYDIYRHNTLNYYNRICDLGNRLEVLTGEFGETVTNIWIEEPEATEAAPSPNVYQITIHAHEAQDHHEKLIGYAAGHTEFDALKASGFTGLNQTGYTQDANGKDFWTYTAANAFGCIVGAKRI